MPESEDVSVTIAPNMLRAAVNANPMLRMTMHLVRAPKHDDGKAYLAADMPGPPGPDRHIVLSIPDELWAMTGRRPTLDVRISLSEDDS